MVILLVVGIAMWKGDLSIIARLRSPRLYVD
jgi:hypothetical protein